MSYDKVKKNRSINSIVFHIEKKRPSEGNSNKLDLKAYQDDKTQKEAYNRLLAGESLQSPYTKILSENMLPFPNYFMDIKTMAGLKKKVYPLYDELKDIRGLNGGKDHFSYASSKHEG